MDLFEIAKGSATSKKAKDKKEEVIMSSSMFEGSIKNKKSQALEFAEKMNKLLELEEQKASITAQIAPLEDEIRQVGKVQFIKLIKRLGKRISSFTLRGIRVENDTELPGNGKTVIFMDKYKNLDEERYNYLKNEYGNDLVSETTEYSLNGELIKKYGKIISKLITECKDIPDIDKINLITSTVTYSVSKGTIEKLHTFENPQIMLEEISPVQQLKNCN